MSAGLVAIAEAHTEYKAYHTAQHSRRTSVQVLAVAVGAGVGIVAASVGVFASGLSLATGENWIKSESLSHAERCLELANVVAIVVSRSSVRTAAVLKNLDSQANRAVRWATAVGQIITKTDAAVRGTPRRVRDGFLPLGRHTELYVPECLGNTSLRQPKGIHAVTAEATPKWPVSRIPKSFHLKVAGRTFRVKADAARHLHIGTCKNKDRVFASPVASLASAVENAASERHSNLTRNATEINNWETILNEKTSNGKFLQIVCRTK
jgi:hypothetical protein